MFKKIIRCVKNEEYAEEFRKENVSGVFLIFEEESKGFVGWVGEKD